MGSVATAFELAEYNPAQICIAARNVVGGHAAVAELEETTPKFDIRFVECDLANFESISRAAKEVIRKGGGRLDVSILNAGIVRLLSLFTCFQPIIMFSRPERKTEINVCITDSPHDRWVATPAQPSKATKSNSVTPSSLNCSLYSPCHGREKCQLSTACHIPQLKRSRPYRHPPHRRNRLLHSEILST